MPLLLLLLLWFLNTQVKASVLDEPETDRYRVACAGGPDDTALVLDDSHKIVQRFEATGFADGADRSPSMLRPVERQEKETR